MKYKYIGSIIVALVLSAAAIPARAEEYNPFPGLYPPPSVMRAWAAYPRRYHPPVYAPPVYAAPPLAYVAPLPPAPDETIRRIQLALNALMNARLNVDGIAGPSTVAAITNFQIQNGLVADGIAGDNTLVAINARLYAAAALVNSVQVTRPGEGS